MTSLIVYASEYGTTKSYAEKMSEITGIPMTNYEDIKDLSAYETIIHFGGLYAGGVKGLKNTIEALPQRAKLIIITVGLADVSDKENADSIKASICRQVSKEVLDRASIFHLRGGIDYPQLKIKHKIMMALLYQRTQKLPEEKKTAEVRAMMETYNQKVSFLDYNSLTPIIEEVSRS